MISCDYIGVIDVESDGGGDDAMVYELMACIEAPASAQTAFMILVCNDILNPIAILPYDHYSDC